eukprot:25902-Chlamydomonas_euryale.AAC.1
MQGCAAECTILLPYTPPYTPPIVRMPYRTVPPSSTYWPYRATLIRSLSKAIRALSAAIRG